MKKTILKIAEIKSGFLFKESIKSDKDGIISVIQLKDVDENGILNVSNLQRITLENVDHRNFITAGDVLLKAKTNHPVSVFVKDVSANTIVTAHYFIIRIKRTDVLPGYLAWYLNQRPAQNYFDKQAGGTRIQVINKQVLGELEVVIPGRNIQEKIVKIYSLYQKEQNLMDVLQAKKHKLILSQLLSVID
ncbi:restriction endonuclease subunit S [Candidatus Desantisbacteria bacterium]|nr:restriction endonuclease subunit S [Candidatus Desantisbacteria bacterium]